jgi:hypothetical protein
MILGIVGASYGVVLGWLFPIPSLVLGIVGLFKWRGAARNGQATTGLVLGLINTALASLGTLVFAFFFVVGFVEGFSSSY